MSLFTVDKVCIPHQFSWIIFVFPAHRKPWNHHIERESDITCFLFYTTHMLTGTWCFILISTFFFSWLVTFCLLVRRFSVPTISKWAYCWTAQCRLGCIIVRVLDKLFCYAVLITFLGWIRRSWFSCRLKILFRHLA